MPATATSMELEGVVCPGLGEGARFTAIDWVIEEFRLKLGFVPSPGTFNLHMAGAHWDSVRGRLQTEAGIGITPAAGFCAAKCFTVRIAGQVAGAVVFPDMDDYPSSKFEIVAPVPVRSTLGVRNGDRVFLRVDIGRT